LNLTIIKIDKDFYRCGQDYYIYLIEHPKLIGKYEIYKNDTFIERAINLSHAKEIIKNNMTKVIELKDLHCALGHMTYKVSGFVSAYKEDNQVKVEAVSLDVVILDNVGEANQMYKLNDIQKANFENRLTYYPQFHQFIETQL
jgi:hypothetical protein